MPISFNSSLDAPRSISSSLVSLPFDPKIFYVYRQLAEEFTNFCDGIGHSAANYIACRIRDPRKYRGAFRGRIKDWPFGGDSVRKVFSWLRTHLSLLHRLRHELLQQRLWVPLLARGLDSCSSGLCHSLGIALRRELYPPSTPRTLSISLFRLHAGALDHHVVTGEQAVGQGMADSFLTESQICDTTSRDDEA